MNDDLVVSVRGLVKAYGNRRVVDGLDLDVAAGEIVGLIGANGAGKTTTVECIQGLRRPDAGRLRVFGLDPLADAPAARAGGQPAAKLRAARPAPGSRGGAAVQRRGPGGPAGAVRPGRASPFAVRVAQRRRAAAAVPGAGRREPAPAGDSRRAHPGPGSSGAPRRVGGDRRAARRGDHGAAGDPRTGRGRGAVRPGRGDAGRAGSRLGHTGRAGGPLRPVRHDHLHDARPACIRRRWLGCRA